MTLAKGDHVVKLNPTTKEPIKFEESYVEFEVLDLSPTYNVYPTNDVQQWLLVKKIL